MEHAYIMKLTNGPHKLECYIILCCKACLKKHSSLFGPFLSYQENKALWIWPLGWFVPKLSKLWRLFILDCLAVITRWHYLNWCVCLHNSFFNKKQNELASYVDTFCILFILFCCNLKRASLLQSAKIERRQCLCWIGQRLSQMTRHRCTFSIWKSTHIFCQIFGECFQFFLSPSAGRGGRVWTLDVRMMRECLTAVPVLVEAK